MSDAAARTAGFVVKGFRLAGGTPIRGAQPVIAPVMSAASGLDAPTLGMLTRADFNDARRVSVDRAEPLMPAPYSGSAAKTRKKRRRRPNWHIHC